MILRVGIRGNGEQLAEYLLGMGENSHVEILEIDGREEQDTNYFRQVIMSMQFNSELTKTDKAFWNTQINPAYGEDKEMTREDWYKAADILAKGTGFERQRRVIVLHTKKGRTHAHVVWERYDHLTGKMIDNKNMKFKADLMRPVIEQALGHKSTPRRNPQRAELKEAVTALWNETRTGAEFLTATRKAGYMVASGTGNRPFMIVDENGRSFDLVRQIKGVRTKEVRARLRGEPLVTDKQAIDLMREQGDNSGKREKQKMSLTPDNNETVRIFARNRNDAVIGDQAEEPVRNFEPVFNEFKTEGETISAQPKVDDVEQRKQQIAQEFAETKASGIDEEAQRAIELQNIIDLQAKIRERNKQKKRHR